MYVKHGVSGASRHYTAAGSPSQRWECPVHWLPPNTGLPVAGVTHIDRDAAESEADRSADAPSQRRTDAPQAAVGGETQNTLRALDGLNKKRRGDVDSAHLAYLSGQRVHPLTGRDGCVRVQQHLHSGRREDTLLQHLEGGRNIILSYSIYHYLVKLSKSQYLQYYFTVLL